MKGKLTIVTQIDDGEETFATFDGEMSFSPLNANVYYNDGEASVKIALDSQKMTIERSGDYGFPLN